MTEAKNASPKIKATHIIVALLVIVAVLQAAILVRQSSNKTRGKDQAVEQMLPSSRALPASLVAGPRSKALPTAATPAPSFSDADPFEEFDAMSRRMSNMMRKALIMATPIMQQVRQAADPDFIGSFSPAIDLEDTEKAYIVRSDLPGLEKDKINLTVTNNVLTIEGVRQSSKETADQNQGFYAQERSYGSFARSLPLPGPVDESRISAEYTNGVLTITLPKIAVPKTTQKVPIQ